MQLKNWAVHSFLVAAVCCSVAGRVAADEAPAGKSAASSATKSAPVSDKVFYVYSDKGAPTNHFAPSGWMGDYGAIKLDDGNTEKPASGKTAMKWTYSGKDTQGAHWAGVYWQHPPNNWGSRAGGYDLSKYKKLVFQARGAAGGEKVEFKFGGISGENGDSDSGTTGPMELTKDWKSYSIELTDKNMAHIIGGFCWVASHDDNANGVTMYLDDIHYE